MPTNSSTSTLVSDGPQKLAEVLPKALQSPLEHVKPHNEFWFPDGNLILIARDVAFRVYRGLLSEQSTVFADMFAASSADADELCDGCPIVRLFDSPEDLVHFFRVLLPKSRRRWRPRKDEQKHTFDEVSALVRLSHKYCVQDLQEQALDSLRERFTDNFDHWGRGCTSISVKDVQAIGAVNLARLTDTPSLLPAALYLCCNLGPDLLDGWKREDGYVEHLSAGDLKRCFVAQEKLCKEGGRVFSEIFDGQPSEGCWWADKCRVALKEMVVSSVKLCLSAAIECSVMRTWNAIIEKRSSDHQICAACKKDLRLRDEKARRKAWIKFPEIFGIVVPGWEEK